MSERAKDRRKKYDDHSSALETLSDTLDLSKTAVEYGKVDVPGYGFLLDFLSKAAHRGGTAEKDIEAFGGGAVESLSGELAEEAFRKLTKQGPELELPTGGDLALSAFKFLANFEGDNESEKGFKLKDAAEAIEAGRQLFDPKELFKEGMVEGFSGLYDITQGAASLLADGNTDKFLELGKKQLSGEKGHIRQGYTMLADVIGGAITGDWSEVNRMSEMAEEGKAGTLPKIGDWLGDHVFELLHQNDAQKKK